MRLLILSLNYAPEEIGIAVYSAGMARFLAARGHDVRVIAAKAYYPQWRVAPGQGRGWQTTTEAGVKITRCPLYVPQRPSGMRRLLHHLSFALSAAIPLLWNAIRHRPQVMVAVAPSLIAAPVGWLAARLCGATTWLHVQDFEVDAAVATGLVRRDAMLIRQARRVEGVILRRFDRLSSIGPAMCARLRDYGIAAGRCHEFRNWADVDAVRPLDRPSSYRDEWQITAPHVALYSGNIANKQGIEIVVEAARHLRARDDLVFVICGEGSNRAILEQAAADCGNVVFRDLQPQDRLGDLCGLATVHLLPQLADAADLVLPSKLTNMLASGRPVVATAAAGTGLACEVEGCGLVTPPGDAAAFANAIAGLIDDAPLRERLGIAARTRAEERWSKEAILQHAENQMVGEIHKFIKGHNIDAQGCI